MQTEIIDFSLNGEESHLLTTINNILGDLDTKYTSNEIEEIKLQQFISNNGSIFDDFGLPKTHHEQLEKNSIYLCKSTNNATPVIKSMDCFGFTGKPSSYDFSDHYKIRGNIMSSLKPSNFTGYPWGSIFRKEVYETIAQNVMIILKKTGDCFRELSWEEYKAFQEIDGNFTMVEKYYFDKVVNYCSTEEKALEFCPKWISYNS